MSTPDDVVDTAVDVLCRRYQLSDDDALDMLCISSRANHASLRGLASWVIYDAEGHYYPEPEARP